VSARPRTAEDVAARAAKWADTVAPVGPEEVAASAEEDELTLTDTGNAARLAELHGERLRFVPAFGKWLVWSDDGRWVLDHGDVFVREMAKDVGAKLRDRALEELAAATSKAEAKPAQARLDFALRSLEARRIRDMVDLARGIDGIPVDHESLDADGWILGVANGAVDLRNGKLRPASPDDLLTRVCPVAWDDAAPAERWTRALEEWFPDAEVRGYVQRVAGAALVGAQTEHVLVIHYGDGGNGKTTFTRALQRVLGPYAVEAHPSLLVETRYKEHDTVRADLFRARLAVAVETDRRVRLAEASVKNLTGADRIRARRMREDPWSFEPTHSLWLQSNHLPAIAGRDRGIWRRIRVVRWLRTFEDAEQDRDLDATLAAEAPGILRWLVGGCLAWQEHGLAEPEAVVRDTLAYRRAEDALRRFAEDVGLTFRADLRLRAQELQDLLATWANEEGISPPRQDVGGWLKDSGCRQTTDRWTDATGKTRQARFWLGVGVAGEPLHEAEQTDLLAEGAPPVTAVTGSPVRPVRARAGETNREPRNARNVDDPTSELLR